MRNFDKVTTIPDRAIASYQFHEETERSERLEKDKLTTQQTLHEESERSEQLERERLTTQQALEVQIEQNNKIRSNLYWQCRKTSTMWARGISLLLAVFLLTINCSVVAGNCRITPTGTLVNGSRTGSVERGKPAIRPDCEGNIPLDRSNPTSQIRQTSSKNSWSRPRRIWG